MKNTVQWAQKKKKICLKRRRVLKLMTGLKRDNLFCTPALTVEHLHVDSKHDILSGRTPRSNSEYSLAAPKHMIAPIDTQIDFIK